MAKTIKSMTDQELLEEYTVLSYWAGDDFSPHQFEDKEDLRFNKLRTEILRRMAKREVAA